MFISYISTSTGSNFQIALRCHTLCIVSSGAKSEKNDFCSCWSSVNIFLKITLVYLKKKEILRVCTGIIKHSESYWCIFCSVLIPGLVGSATNLNQISFPRSRKLFIPQRQQIYQILELKLTLWILKTNEKILNNSVGMSNHMEWFFFITCKLQN